MLNDFPWEFLIFYGGKFHMQLKSMSRFKVHKFSDCSWIQGLIWRNQNIWTFFDSYSKFECRHNTTFVVSSQFGDFHLIATDKATKKWILKFLSWLRSLLLVIKLTICLRKAVAFVVRENFSFAGTWFAQFLYVSQMILLSLSIFISSRCKGVTYEWHGANNAGFYDNSQWYNKRDGKTRLSQYNQLKDNRDEVGEGWKIQSRVERWCNYAIKALKLLAKETFRYII